MYGSYGWETDYKQEKKKKKTEHVEFYNMKANLPMENW